MHLSTKACATSTSVATSASTKRVFWNEPIGWPKAVRSFTYSSAQSRAARAIDTPATAIDRRSWGRLATR